MRQFQAVLTCNQDPCTYCRRPREAFVVAHPNGPFDTEEEARDHGWGMAQKVYGSEHTVSTETRYVGPWNPVES